MKQHFLRFYDKLIIAALMGVLALFGCSRKTYPDKSREQAESKTDSLKKSDTIHTVKDRFDNRVIAMYGVRPTKEIE